MRYKDLEFSTQILLVTFLAILLSVVVIRAALFIFRNFTGVAQRYPRTWTPTQCRLMDRFRMLVGLALSALWIALLFAVPHMPTNWPFGLLEGISILVLLLLSNAWILLLLPRAWDKFGPLANRFSVFMGALLLWWTLMFGGTVWMIAKAAAPRLPPVFHGPVLAAGTKPALSNMLTLFNFSSARTNCKANPKWAMTQTEPNRDSQLRCCENAISGTDS